ncbi:MAG: ABC transporter permease [Pseudomonadota bacterium]|nr:ABC transporter permease [Pseudomonadota bacterium]
MLVGLAWRNIWRQKHRTVLSLSSIALAAMMMVSLLSLQLGVYGTMKENVLRLADGFAQVQPKGYSDDPDLHKTIADPAAVMAALGAIPAVTASAPRGESYAILSFASRSYGAAVIGIDPAREPKVTTLGASLSAGRSLRPGDDGAVLVGAGLARNLKLRPGDRLTLLGAARDGSVAADLLTVKGIFSTGAADLDRQLIEMPLARFQSDFAMGRSANVVAVSGRSLGAIQSNLPGLDAVAKRYGLVLRDWTDLEPALNDIILLDMSIALLWYVCIIVIVVFIILNTLLMSVLERTREFGMLMAIGMRPSQIGRMVWIELLFLAGLGALLGIALGAGLTLWASAHGIAFSGAEALFSQWQMPSTLYPQLSWVSALSGPLVISLAIALAGLVPYVRVRRLEPVSAMRAV